MTTLYANDQTNLLSINLNFWFANFFDHELNLGGTGTYPDDYHIYTITNESLSLYGSNFGYDGNGDMTFGTIEALSQWVWKVDAALPNGGEWVERWHWEGWDIAADYFWNVADTPGTADDLALIADVMSGADTLYLSDFDDDMRGFKGADVMFGRIGADILRGNDGQDMLQGNQGADTLYGNRGNDTLSGGRGKDQLFGGYQDDILRGGKWRDELTGGLGEDVFRFNTGDQIDIIMDFDARGAKHDVMDLSGLASIRGWWDLKNNHMEQDQSDVVIDGGDGDLITLKDVDLADLDKADFLF